MKNRNHLQAFFIIYSKLAKLRLLFGVKSKHNAKGLAWEKNTVLCVCVCVCFCF